MESQWSLLPLAQMFINVLKEGYIHVLLLSLMSVLDPPGDVVTRAAGLAGIVFLTDARFSFYFY